MKKAFGFSFLSFVSAVSDMRSILLKTKNISFFEFWSFCSKSLFLESSGIRASRMNTTTSASFIARITVGQCPILLRQKREL